MKRLMLFLPSCISILVATGCAHTVRFSVVDAENSKPIERVEAEWKKTRYGLIKDVENDSEKLPRSNNKGLVVASPVFYTMSEHDFVFTKEGYQPARMYLSGGKGIVLSPDPFSGVTNTVSWSAKLLPLADPVVIPMHRIVE